MSPAAKTDLTPPVKARRGREASQPVVERMEAELARWVDSVQSLEERQPLGTKFRTFIPLRCGSKAVESHSMHERGFNYRGQEDFMKKPHGSGEVVFSNGDIYSGQEGFHFKLNKKASQKASKDENLNLLHFNLLNETFSQFVDGLRHGQGLLRIKKELTRNIKGEMVDSTVSFIEGSFVADKLEGPGLVSKTRV